MSESEKRGEMSERLGGGRRKEGEREWRRERIETGKEKDWREKEGFEMRRIRRVTCVGMTCRRRGPGEPHTPATCRPPLTWALEAAHTHYYTMTRRFCP